jgi:hypothetical protein
VLFYVGVAAHALDIPRPDGLHRVREDHLALGAERIDFATNLEHLRTVPEKGATS